MDTLESRLQHTFRKPELLAEAITHPSVPYENKAHTKHNQRLEFLGDAVLQLILTEALYLKFPEVAEGTLTKFRTQLVQARALAKVARDLQIGPDLLLGKGENTHGGRQRDSTLADALEAIIGAIYLDSGLAATSAFIHRRWASELEALHLDAAENNPKGELQEKLQDAAGRAPLYQITGVGGPDHARNFKAIVVWEGETLGAGSGKSKKEAETAAARNALDSPVLSETLTRLQQSRTSTDTKPGE
jgi:ribonuclease III